MNDEVNNYKGFILFFALIVVIVLCGSVFVYKSKIERDKDKIIKNNEVIINDKNKVDKNKDFIYFIDEEQLNSNLNIIYKVPVINLKNEKIKELNNLLKEEALANKKSIVKKGEEDTCEFDNDGIKEAGILNYTIYEHNEYVTLIIEKLIYDCNSGESKLNKISSHTFNVLTNEEVLYDKLLKDYNITYTDVISKIEQKLKEEQHSNSNILADSTINKLKENETYIIYLNENGNLTVKYIVKTNTLDYNDVIILN